VGHESGGLAGHNAGIGDFDLGSAHGLHLPLEVLNIALKV
jgi:hypothetical protein